MDRKEFLKKACWAGACGCALGYLRGPEPVTAAEPPVEDQRLLFTRYQIANLVGFMASGVPPDLSAEILQKTGRERARLGRLGERFKGDPKGYFAAATKSWGTEFTWDEETGVVTVSVAEGDCGCPLVDAKRTPAVWCSCSVGYQAETFEAVFGRPVKARLKESKLSGSARCVFEVTLA
jgi:hypothetical protein